MKKQESKTTAGLLPLHVDIVFKIFCIKYPHLLSDLLNAVLGFEGSNKIEELQILNPEIPGDIATDKVSILDIYATNKQGKHFGVEMQAFPQSYYGKRVLYYWSKLYSQQIDRGNLYSILQPVYSVSFLNFDLLKIENFHSTFLLLEKNNPEITLTKDLEIHIIELRKFLKLAGELKTNLEDWIYLLRQSGSLKENEVNELKVKNPI
ncbi:MAG: Rpn family recombination-promoting nuclease/putative transposase, partial [Leptospiraceae bacterium]|nr:Rpn family recombination-promoting nuclease/putative transposase [Leptospiraceae bacterium]